MGVEYSLYQRVLYWVTPKVLAVSMVPVEEAPVPLYKPAPPV